MDRPCRRILHCQALHAYISAVCDKDRIRTPRGALHFCIHPPVTVLRIAVNRALSDDIQILHVDRGDQGCKAVQRIAFPRCDIVFLIVMVQIAHHTGQDGIMAAIGIPEQGCTLIHPEGHMTLKKQRSRIIRAFRKPHRSVLGAGHDRRLQSRGIVMTAIPHRTETAYIQQDALRFGTETLLKTPSYRRVIAHGIHHEFVFGIRRQTIQRDHVFGRFLHYSAIQQQPARHFGFVGIFVVSLDRYAAVTDRDDFVFHSFLLKYSPSSGLRPPSPPQAGGRQGISINSKLCSS